MRLGIAAFLVPLAFALNPALLLQGEWPAIVHAGLTALAGSVLVAAGLRGFAFTMLGAPSRILVAVGGALLIMPGIEIELLGAALAVLGLGLAAFPIGQVSAVRRDA